MQKKSYIARLLSGVLLCFVLLSSVFSKELPLQKNAQNTKEQRSEKSSKPKSAQQSYLSELQMAVVIPAHGFQFAQDAIILPTPQICFIVSKKVLVIISKPLFKNSYFDKIFERHIAINAP